MKNILTTLVLAICCSFAATAQVDRTKPPLPGPPPKVVIGDYQAFTMANGLRVIVVENHKIPKVSYNLVLDYDPVMEGTEKGYVEFTGRLLGTGTTTRTKDQINEGIDFIGASVFFNAGGFYASSLKKHNEKLLEIVSDALINASFTEEELEKVRTKALSELAASKKEPEAISARVASKLMYGTEHPYGYSQTEASVKAVTLEKCSEFYKNFFRPNIAYLAVVGDISVQEVRPLLDKFFSSWQSAEVPKALYEIPEQPKSNVVAIVDRPVSVQSLIRVCYPVQLRIGQEDFIKVRVANTILGGGTFRLFDNLREKHGWTYGAYSQLNWDKLTGSFFASADVRNAVTDSAVTQILGEMKRLTEEKVPDDELNRIKNYASGTFALSLEDPQTIARFALNIEMFNLPKDYYEKYLENIAAITSEDILQVSRKYFKPSNAYILLVSKAEDVAASMAPFSSDQKILYYDVDGNIMDAARKSKPLPADLTAEKVVEKYLEAIGGRKKLGKIKDITTTMSMSMQGMNIMFSTYQKAPNKLRVEVSVNGSLMSKQVFDGTKGFVGGPMGGQVLEGDELGSMKNQSYYMPELDYGAAGIRIDLKGAEEVNGKDAYVVELTYPNGFKESEYYDAVSGLKVRKLGDQGIQDISDYKEVDGIKFPFAVKQEIQGMDVEMKVISVEMNKKLADDLFKAE